MSALEFRLVGNTYKNILKFTPAKARPNSRIF